MSNFLLLELHLQEAHKRAVMGHDEVLVLKIGNTMVLYSP